jgi:hypothetical protein
MKHVINHQPMIRGRGRPRAVCEPVITPELARKHASGVTQDVLDQLLRRGVILPAHHYAAMRMRYWRAVAFGVAAPRAVQWGVGSPTAGIILSDEDRAQSRSDYLNVQRALADKKLWSMVAHVCFGDPLPAYHACGAPLTVIVYNALAVLAYEVKCVLDANGKENLTREQLNF